MNLKLKIGISFSIFFIVIFTFWNISNNKTKVEEDSYQNENLFRKENDIRNNQNSINETNENYLESKSDECNPYKLTHFKSDSLQNSFIEYLNSLNCHEPKSLGLATNQILKIFSKTNKNYNDSLFFIFNEFYSLVNDTLNNLLEHDTTDYMPYISFNSHKRIPPNVKSYIEKLKKNGFDFVSSEGLVFINQNRKYLEQFYPFLTPKMISFLKQRDYENNNWFWEDGSIVISENEFLKRVLWWEKFSNKSKGFIFENYAKEEKKLYLYFALVGTDNSWLFEENDSRILEPYFQDLYNLALKNIQETENLKIIREHYQILKKHKFQDSDERKLFLEKLKKEGKIKFE